MTLTEFERYKINLYLKLGYITKEQARKYRNNLDIGGIIAFILSVLVTGALVFTIFWRG